MTGAEWERVRPIVDRALELEGVERQRFVAQACGEEDELQLEVERILRRVEEDDDPGFLEPPMERSIEHEFETLGVGARLGKYRLVQELGSGGMGVVYLAEHVELGLRVALKLLPHSQTRSEVRLARFRSEALMVARLKHPGIVSVHDIGQHGEVHFIVMDYVAGPTYAATVDRLRSMAQVEASEVLRSGEYLREQAAVVARVADALHYAHQNDIVHRDVKPTNILLETDGSPRLADFGIAKDLREEGLTLTGELAGTIPYMSPEQARATSTQIDPRSDIFSLGVVLYEALTLHQPFRGSTVQESLDNVLHKAPSSVRLLNRSIPKDLETICHKALDKDPNHRYQNAALLAGDLRCFVEGRPILASPPSLWRRGTVWVHAHRLSVLSGAVVLLALGLGMVVVREQRRRRALQCEITLESEYEGVMLSVRLLDEETLAFGREQDLGRAPLTRRLAVGHYRFTFTRPGGEFAHASVLVRSGQRIHLKPRFVDVPLEDMIRIEGSPGLASFLIDTTEVSNADFDRFLMESGHPEPVVRSLAGYPTPNPNHPVVGIQWDDAQAYSRWVGKRLPTEGEWELAAMGPQGARLPWSGEEPRGLPNPSPEEISEVKVGGQGSWEQYEKYSRPVQSDPQLATANGLFHMATNVREFVDATRPSRGVMTKGGAWVDAPRHYDFRTDSWDAPRSWSIKTGFRCARSLRP